MIERYFVTEPKGTFAWYVVRDRHGSRFPNQEITYYSKDLPDAKRLAYQEAEKYNSEEPPLFKLLKDFE